MLSTLLAATLHGFNPTSLGASCTDLLDDVSTISASTISLSVSGADQQYESNGLDAGIDQWNTECQGTIPAFTRTAGGDLAVSLEFTDHQSPSDSRANDYCSGKCGCYDTMTSTVYIHNKDVGGTDCTTYYTSLVAHELGHVLGLADVSGCTGSLMGDQLQLGLQVTQDEV